MIIFLFLIWQGFKFWKRSELRIQFYEGIPNLPSTKYIKKTFIYDVRMHTWKIEVSIVHAAQYLLKKAPLFAVLWSRMYIFVCIFHKIFFARAKSMKIRTLPNKKEIWIMRSLLLQQGCRVYLRDKHAKLICCNVRLKYILQKYIFYFYQQKYSHTPHNFHS